MSINRSAHRGVALITGAGSRIGAAYAYRLARRGHDLLLVACEARKLDAFTNRLEAATGRRVTVLEANLRTEPGRAKVDDVLRNDPNITVLVNAAGVGSAASILGVDAVSAGLDTSEQVTLPGVYQIQPQVYWSGDDVICVPAEASAVRAMAKHRLTQIHE